MKYGEKTKNTSIITLCVILTLIFFLVDIFIPLGVAGGVPYVVVILLALGLRGISPVLSFAIGCTILTVCGFFISPEGGATWQVLVNRGLAIFAIWITAILSLQRKYAIDALRAGERQLRSMADTIPALVAYINDTEQIQFHNAVWKQWFGEARQQLYGKRLRDILDKEFYRRFANCLATVLDGQEVSFESDLKSEDGIKRYVHASLVPNRNHFGKIIGFYLLVIDLTDHRRAEEALCESEERYRLLVVNAPVGIHEIDLEGRLITINETGLKMLGEDEEKSTRGKMYVDLIRPENRSRIEALQEHALSGEPSQQFEFKATNGLGSKYFLSSLVPLKDSQGNVMKLMGVSLDITKRKSIEEELESQRTFLRQMIDLNPSFVFAKDQQGRFTLANQALADAYGTTVENLIGARETNFSRNITEVERFRRDDLEVMNTLRDKLILEESFTDFKGEVRWLQTIKRAILNANNKADQILGISTDITLHKKAQDALREGEERYRAVVESQTELVCRFLPDTTLTFVNGAYCHCFGKTRKELVGQRFLALIPKNEQQLVVAKLKDLVQNPKITKYEHKVIQTDGSRGWQQWIDYPICDSDGNVREIQSVGRDITDRKRAEELLKKTRDELEVRVKERTAELSEINSALKNEILERKKTEESLRKSYDLLNGLTEGTTDVVYVKDLSGRYLMMNSAGAKILKKAKEEIIGGDDKMLFSSDAANSILRRDRQIIASGEGETYEESMTVAGSTRTFFSTKGPLRDHQGNIIGIIGITRDVTQRKQAEEALQASEERFRALYHNNPSMFFTVNTEGVIISVNVFGASQLGYTVKELIGQSVFAIFYDEDKKAAQKQFKNFVNGSTPIGHWEFRKVHRNGSVLWVKETARMVKGIDDELVILVVCENITHRKQAEIELKKAHDELEERVRERTGELSLALTQVKDLKNRLQAENVYLQEEIKLSHNFEEIVTKSGVLKKTLSQVEQVATTGATVLILGESGTGKELIARAVHNLSTRRDRSLVKVDCAALPGNLIESELFGHEKGAFTGAVSRRIGRFELADGGTIFLDEIGELPLNLQTKLLRILQYSEFERVGGTTTINVDVRVIAATNRNLERAVRESFFREDLYFRLNVFPIRIPPLRERKEDIPLLVRHFIQKFTARLSKNIKRIPHEALDALMEYAWPGNVRELENIIERAVIVTKGPTLDLGEQPGTPLNSAEQISDNHTPTIKEVEQSLIRKALEESSWIIQGDRGAAVRLDMPPSTLRERMKKYHIKRP